MSCLPGHNRFFCVSTSLLICLWTFSAAAQRNFSIHASIDKPAIVIGEPFHINLQANFPQHEAMRFFIVDTIPHFEILERKKIDTLDHGDSLKLTQTLTLTSFDSGKWVIPPFELPGDQPALSDSFEVNVTFSTFDANQDYHDIKDVIDVPVPPKKKSDWYIYAAISALIVATMVILLMKKKKPQAAKVVVTDPYADARDQLAKLKKENPPAKVFFTQLVDIFRVYIARRRGVASLQRTTDDLVVQLRSLGFAENDFNRLAQSLRMSDFVKFARYEPSMEDRSEAFDIVSKVIDHAEKHRPVETPPSSS